jgi:AcrR family transcriptional regulator
MSTREAPEPIWSRPEPGARNARFSREKIAAAALEIGRKEGKGAVSMRRVASELGAGTMTLYHYVANKGELFALMHDAMMGDLIVPEADLERGWRDAMRAIAYATLEAWRENRWQRDDIAESTALGPNGMRHFEQSLKAVAATGLPMHRRFEIVSQLDEYVFGFAEGNPDASEAEQEDRLEEFLAGAEDYVQQELERGDFPNIEEFLGEDDFMTAVRRMFLDSSAEERFERGLRRLLDGIQSEIEREAGS